MEVRARTPKPLAKYVTSFCCISNSNSISRWLHASILPDVKIIQRTVGIVSETVLRKIAAMVTT